MNHSLNTKPRVCFEVEKVIGVSSDGNVRSYQVQWAPAWVSSFHLVGCEHLIQEFLQNESQLSQEVSSSPSLTKICCGRSTKNDNALLDMKNLAARRCSKVIVIDDDDMEINGKKQCIRSTTDDHETSGAFSVQNESIFTLPVTNIEQNDEHPVRSNGEKISPISETSERPNIFDLLETPELNTTNMDNPESQLDSSKINGNEAIPGPSVEQSLDRSAGQTQAPLQPNQMRLRELDHRKKGTGLLYNECQPELPELPSHASEVSVKIEEEEKSSNDALEQGSFGDITRDIKVEMLSPDSDTPIKRGKGRPRGRLNKKRSFPAGKSYHLVRKKITEMKQSIAELAAGGKYSAAFEKAVASAEFPLLLFLCKQVKPIEVFRGGTNPYLSQSLLLKIIQQLSVDLEEDTKTKVAYLLECVPLLDKKDEMTREHISMVLDFLTGQLYQTIDGMTRANPTAELLEPLNMLLRTSRTMLSRCRR